MNQVLVHNNDKRLRGETVVRFLRTMAACSVLWGLMTKWNPESLIVGVPTVLFAAWAYTKLRNANRPPLAVVPGIRFGVFFLWASIVSGIDIALRVVAPRVRIAPGFITFTTELNSLPAQVFLANAVSLIPGTLSVGLEGRALLIHAIDIAQPNEANLRKLESLVGKMFRDDSVIEEATG